MCPAVPPGRRSRSGCCRWALGPLRHNSPAESTRQEKQAWLHSKFLVYSLINSEIAFFLVFLKDLRSSESLTVLWLAPLSTVGWLLLWLALMITGLATIHHHNHFLHLWQESVRKVRHLSLACEMKKHTHKQKREHRLHCSRSLHSPQESKGDF